MHCTCNLLHVFYNSTIVQLYGWMQGNGDSGAGNSTTVREPTELSTDSLDLAALLANLPYAGTGVSTDRKVPAGWSKEEDTALIEAYARAFDLDDDEDDWDSVTNLMACGMTNSISYTSGGSRSKKACKRRFQRLITDVHGLKEAIEEHVLARVCSADDGGARDEGGGHHHHHHQQQHQQQQRRQQRRQQRPRLGRHVRVRLPGILPLRCLRCRRMRPSPCLVSMCWLLAGSTHTTLVTWANASSSKSFNASRSSSTSIRSSCTTAIHVHVFEGSCPDSQNRCSSNQLTKFIPLPTNEPRP